MSMATITAHCLVKNEENFVWYAIKSVVDFVDKVIIFDTGSTDKTVEIVQGLVKEYPDKIIFEEKGECDKNRHTELRQEMVDRTTTDWFMILDGDEVWTKRGMEEVIKTISENREMGCLIAPYYLLVGDIYHHSVRGKYKYGKIKIHASARFFNNKKNTRWNLGPYSEGDFMVDERGDVIRGGNYISLKNKYWHASALLRSSKDEDLKLGRHKQVLTHSLIIIGEGFRIKEQIPEIFFKRQSFVTKKLSALSSWVYLIKLFLFKIGLRKKRY
jgi:glycosyltransferase involved in cell wall biosynthesis